MPYNMRTPGNGGDSKAAHQYPVPRTLAMLVIAAVVILWALRHIYGAITVEAGTR